MQLSFGMMNRNNTMKLAGVAAVLVVAAMMVAAQFNAGADVIRAGRVEIMRGDRVLAALDADERGGALHLYNTTGWENLTLRSAEDGDGLLVLRDRSGAQRLALRSTARGGQVMLFTDDEDAARVIGPEAATTREPEDELPPEPALPLDPEAPGQTVELVIASLRQAIHQLEQRQLELQSEVRELNHIAPDSPVGDTRRTIESLSRALDDQSAAVRRLEQSLRQQTSAIDALRRQVRDLERRVR